MNTLETGNALADGEPSRGWFIGDLAAWAAARGESARGEFSPDTLRQSGAVEVKWFMHPPGDERVAWAPPDRNLTLTIIIEGALTLYFRSIDGEERTVDLVGRGEYALWHGPSYTHSWRTQEGCTLVTVRWPVQR